MKKLFLSLVVLATLAVSAVAGPNYNVCFFPLDVDGDDLMSKGEFLVAFPEGDLAEFEEADADNDGMVSHGEWEDWKASHGFEEGDLHG